MVHQLGDFCHIVDDLVHDFKSRLFVSHSNASELLNYIMYRSYHQLDITII